VTTARAGGTHDGPGWLRAHLTDWLARHEAELVALRRHIHANPELSGQERATAALVAERLRAVGLTPRLLAGRNGVICDVGAGDRVVALRADLDALPVPDTKDVPYRSTVENVCHACGHDVHTAILVGVGRVLAELHRAGELPGRVRLIFQPSEERLPSGSLEVIAEGGLAEVQSIFALHCDPRLRAGYAAVRSGPITAAADMMDVRVFGPGGHTARPHLTVDLAYALGRIVVEVPALLSRRLDPRAAASVVFGAIRVGETHNAVAAEGYAKGTVRVLDHDGWRVLPDLVPRLVRDAVAGTGAEVDIDYVRGVPPVINDRATTAILEAAVREALGPDQLSEAEVSMGGEDFAFYLQHVPGTMFRLGVGRADASEVVDIHQPSFDVDESALGCGVRIMVHTALAALTARP